jgi:N6-adenosine-specific RNA methylase IME4
MDRAPDNHYPTQELDEIKALDVPSICADDCVLFLWVPVAFEANGHEIMKAWGFEYVSQQVWVKDQISLGYWFRNRHEILLVGVKGKPVAPALGTQWDSVLEAPAGEHSAKPEAVLEMIEQYYPTVPKIELNRRGPPRPGWSAWGNEAEEEAESWVIVTASSCDRSSMRVTTGGLSSGICGLKYDLALASTGGCFWSSPPDRLKHRQCGSYECLWTRMRSWSDVSALCET